MKDPQQRLMPGDRLAMNFVESTCCYPVLWDNDEEIWNEDEEIWSNVYFITIKKLVYIGP